MIHSKVSIMTALKNERKLLVEEAEQRQRQEQKKGNTLNDALGFLMDNLKKGQEKRKEVKEA